MFKATMQEIVSDKYKAATSGVLFAAISLVATTGTAALGDDFPETMRAALLELSLIESTDDDEHQG